MKRIFERKSDSVMLLVIGLVLLQSQASWASNCAPAESTDKYTSSPTLEINTLEFPNENIRPSGYNVTIVCTTNFSKENWGWHYYSQPYWIQQFFNGDYIGDCGGSDGDSEDSKVCTYVIQNATESDSGNYSCISRNQIHCTIAEIYLEFQEPSPPRFKMDLPLQLNASAGHKANLTCSVSGIPRPVITWFKDGSQVPPSLIREFKGYSMLAFHSVSPKNQGRYWCEASNSEGWNRSSPVNLTVLWRPQLVSIHPEGAFEVINDGIAVVTLFCEANGFPRPVISWLKNNTPVTSDTVSQNGNISSLVLVFNETTEKPMKYRCIARNSQGSTLSKEATLIVTRSEATGFTSPAFFIDPESITASLGETVVFSCGTRGSSYPNITWLKDGMALTNTSAKVIHENTQNISELRIISVSESDIGKYSCQATIGNKQALSRVAELSLKDLDGTPTSAEIIWPSVGVGLLLIIITALAIVKWQKGKKRKSNHLVNSEPINNQQEFIQLEIKHLENSGTINQLRNSLSTASHSTADGAHSTAEENEVVDHEMYLQTMEVDRNWEISRDRLVITEEKLGGGEFGIVNKGIYLRTNGSELPVAVKRPKDAKDQQQLLALIMELETLIQVGRHPNIVSLVGACTFEEPLCVIIEFVSGGSLDNLLRSSRVQNWNPDISYTNIWSRLTERELLKIASDVANGMKHLESKQCIHRDLACRNVLVGSGLVAKVADFGMARDISSDGQYVKTTGGPIPWLWMSMEALRGTFTTKGDVWSFGVVLWEIVTLGELPYKGVNGVIDLHEWLLDGVRLQKPPHCSEELYSIMLRCWEKSPDDRPSFDELYVHLQCILHEETRMYINVRNIKEEKIEGYHNADISL